MIQLTPSIDLCNYAYNNDIFFNIFKITLLILIPIMLFFTVRYLAKSYKEENIYHTLYFSVILLILYITCYILLII